MRPTLSGLIGKTSLLIVVESKFCTIAFVFYLFIYLFILLILIDFSVKRKKKNYIF